MCGGCNVRERKFAAFCKYGAEAPFGLLGKKRLIPWKIEEIEVESQANR